SSEIIIASFAKELAAEEVYHVAYVWLQKRGDVDLFLPSCKPKVCGLELFAKLECSGVFSRKDLSGLRDIAKRINRSDLVEKVDAFTKDAISKKKRRTSEKKCLQKKSSEERQELERTFESMVVQMTVLEKHISLLQRTLCQQKTDFELMDEGQEIIEHLSLEPTVQQVEAVTAVTADPAVGGEVSQVESAPSPTDVVAAPPKISLRSESQSKGVKPSPKPRTRIGRSYPIQESTGDSVHHPLSIAPSHPLPPPQVLPRRNRENTAVTSVPSSRSPIPKLSVPEVRLEEDEGTGDSGMESGSGSAYSTPHLWRHPIQTTLRERKKATRIYMSLKDETRDEDLPYEPMDYRNET
ncbi:hypothetical protein GBAR_LOCUS15595, partial [Geodia barretti]